MSNQYDGSAKFLKKVGKVYTRHSTFRHGNYEISVFLCTHLATMLGNWYSGAFSAFQSGIDSKSNKEKQKLTDQIILTCSLDDFQKQMGKSYGLPGMNGSYRTMDEIIMAANLWKYSIPRRQLIDFK